MAIKKENHNLQITLTPKDYEKLIKIQEGLTALYDIELSKSQVIAFLIKNYGKNPLEKQKSVNDAPRKQEQKSASINKDDIEIPNISAKLRELKERLQLTNKGLAEYIGISESTLEKILGKDQQQPKGKNLQLITDALRKNGII